jgi:leader peptidase (prepilin peptidase)/N-methyltransferase
MLVIAYLIIYLFVFALGAVIGSFLNVLIYRLPRGLDFVRGFSFCPACEHRLYPKDLVPVFSYLAIGGKCRYCGAPISPRYVIVELIAGLAAVLSWTAFMPPVAFLADTLSQGMPGAAFSQGIPEAALPWRDFAGIAPSNAALYFAVLACLIAIAWIDQDTMEIPDSLSIAVAVCGVIAVFIGSDIGLKSHLIGIAASAVPLFLIAFFIEGAFGFGDVKLMAAAGLFLGWQNCLLALFVGIIIGGVTGVVLLAGKKKGRKDHFAFGPSLCIGIAVAMFFGSNLIDLYLGFTW